MIDDSIGTVYRSIGNHPIFIDNAWVMLVLVHVFDMHKLLMKVITIAMILI